jgi:hypothetical protein
VLAARQVAELLAPDGEQRPEDDDLAVLLALEDCLEPGAERQGALSRPGAAAEADDPMSGSSRRSSAMRCSADRPCSPKASRSPRTSRSRLSGVTRARAEPRSEISTTPVLQGMSRATSRSMRSLS